jgi:hypothetical protein
MLKKGNDYLPGVKCYSRQSTVWNNYIDVFQIKTMFGRITLMKKRMETSY